MGLWKRWPHWCRSWLARRRRTLPGRILPLMAGRMPDPTLGRDVVEEAAFFEGGDDVVERGLLGLGGAELGGDLSVVGLQQSGLGRQQLRRFVLGIGGRSLERGNAV